MDEQTLRQTLREIAQEELPETMNRWEDIKNQLPVTKTPNLRRVKRPTILLVAIVLILVSATAYAVFQSQQEGGLEGVREAGLTTEVGESQTVDDVTVKLNYAYADGSRIVVNYGVLVADPEGIMRPMDISGFPIGGIRYRLLDTEQNLQIQNVGNVVSTDTTLDETTITVSFKLPSDLSLPETLNFTLDFVLPVRPQPIRAITRMNMGQLGGELLRMLRLLDVRTLDENFPLTVLQMVRVYAIWFMPGMYTTTFANLTVGFDQVSINPEYTAEPQPLEIPVGGVGPFTYSFTVDVLPRTVINPMVTVDVAGIPMTLEEVIIAPSETQLRLCWLPEEENYWYPDTFEGVSLEIGDNTFARPSFTGRGGGKKNPRYCGTYTFDVFSEGAPPSSLTLRITAFERGISDFSEWKKVEEIIGDTSIFSVDVENQSITNWGDTRGLVEKALVELGYRIEGDWAFVVDIPQ